MNDVSQKLSAIRQKHLLKVGDMHWKCTKKVQEVVGGKETTVSSSCGHGKHTGVEQAGFSLCTCAFSSLMERHRKGKIAV
jgi:hypothetical protein